MNKLIKLQLIIFVFSFASTAIAADYKTTSGHIARVTCKQKGSRLKVWGQILKGPSCKRLDMTIYMKNSENGDRATIRDSIANLNKPGLKFSGKDRVIPSNSKYDITSKYHWHVDQIYSTCNN